MDDTGEDMQLAIQQPADFFFHLPEKFDLVKGSPLFCAGVTTYYPMEKYLTPDMKKTAVIGIGGLGHVAVKFLKKLGYDVTAFTSSEKKIDMIKELVGDDIVTGVARETYKRNQKRYYQTHKEIYKEKYREKAQMIKEYKEMKAQQQKQQ